MSVAIDMEVIVQDESNPGLVFDALMSLASQGFDQLRIAVAYTTLAGSELLMSQLRQRVGARAWGAIPKLLITSLDYGLTEPEALTRWAEEPHTAVLLTNAYLVERGHLRPATAFHPKVYVLDHGGTQSCVLGSANLSRRALTVNSEVVALSRDTPGLIRQSEWDKLAVGASSLDDRLLQRYSALRAGGRPYEIDDPPTPVPLQPAVLPTFPDEVDAGRLDPSRFDRFWVEAGSMTTGGSRNILEVPRQASAFFGFAFANYTDSHVVIGHPVLTLGPRRWNDRQLAWHGAPRMNRMERLTLPTRAQGGPDYASTAVLFRRHNTGFEIEVTDWETPLAVAWRNASTRCGHVFRLGRGPRICGLL